MATGLFDLGRKEPKRPSRVATTQLPDRRRQLFVAVFLAVNVFAAHTAVMAQHQETGQRRSHRIAVLDVEFVLKNLPEVRDSVRQERARQEEMMTEITRQRAELDRAVRQLKGLEVGSEEYASQEHQVSTRISQLRLPRVQRGPDEKTIGLYYEGYQRIKAAVRSIAKQRKIDLVLNHPMQDREPRPEGQLPAREEFALDRNDIVDLTHDVLTFLDSHSSTVITPQPRPASRSVPHFDRNVQ